MCPALIFLRGYQHPGKTQLRCSKKFLKINENNYHFPIDKQKELC